MVLCSAPLCSGMSWSLVWLAVNNVLGQPVGHIFRTAWPLKTEPADCPATSVTNYQSVLRNITGDRRFHLTMVRRFHLTVVEAWNFVYLSAICWKIRSLCVLLMEMFSVVYSRTYWTLCFYYKSYSGWSFTYWFMT